MNLFFSAQLFFVRFLVDFIHLLIACLMNFSVRRDSEVGLWEGCGRVVGGFLEYFKPDCGIMNSELLGASDLVLGASIESSTIPMRLVDWVLQKA